MFAATAQAEAALEPTRWAELATQSQAAAEAVIYVAIDGERWLGMAGASWYDRDRGIAHLWGMWVDPAIRGRGIGEQLVVAVRGWARSLGGRFLRLGVLTSGDDPTPFYERLGFVRTGELATLRRDPTAPVHYLARPV